jgi:plastocyanin
VRQIRPVFALLAAAAIAVSALAGCANSSSAAWTYAPAPPETPRPSVSASASAAASGSAQPSGSGQQGSPAASQGNVVTVVATTPLRFDTPELTIKPNTPFTLVFDNQDPTASHNVVLMNPDGSKVQMNGDTSFFTGPATRQYQIGPLTAGKYPFHCEVHPTAMTGTLTVQ